MPQPFPDPIYYQTLTYHSSNPFMGAKLKVKRAECHLLELEEAARILPKKQNYSFVIAPKPEAGKVEVVYMPSVMPKEFAGVLGDVIHNLRSVFDHVAVALVAVSGRNTSRASFPTGKDKQSFEAALAQTMKNVTPDAHRIIEQLRPYYGGDDSLRALHELDIMDKHKLLIPATSLLHVQRMNASFRGNPITLSGADFRSVADGTNFVATVDCPGICSADEFRLHDNFDARFIIVFGKGQASEGQPIIPMLWNLVDVARGFIEQCERRFLGRDDIS